MPLTAKLILDELSQANTLKIHSTLHQYKIPPNCSDKTMQASKLIPQKFIELLDKIRRRVAYVPEVNDTVSSMKDLGVNLKDDQKEQIDN